MSKQKVWFITGASRGIGAAIAKAALAAGDKVVATGRNPAQIAALFSAYPDQVQAVELDVSQEDQAFSAVALAMARFGRIDVLVNNAGYGQLGLFEENTADEVAQQFTTNVFGSFHVTRAVLPVMRAQRSGHVFNLSSMGGVVGFPAASIYCAAKFAIEGFSESLALEVEPYGIKVTIVEPGFIRTDFLDGSSARYGSRPAADLAEQSAQLRSLYDSYNHQQGGDPAKLAAALLTLAWSSEPPLRYAAGSDAHERIAAKLASQQAELDQWRALSASVDGVRGTEMLT